MGGQGLEMRLTIATGGGSDRVSGQPIDSVQGAQP